MTNEYEFSVEIWEEFTSFIERLDARNRLIDWDDPDMKMDGRLHLAKRESLEKHLVIIRDQYAETFDNIIHEQDPDTNLERIDRHVENINTTTREIESHAKI